MIEIAGFVLRHLYELLADNYDASKDTRRNEEQDAEMAARIRLARLTLQVDRGSNKRHVKSRPPRLQSRDASRDKLPLAEIGDERVAELQDGRIARKKIYDCDTSVSIATRQLRDDDEDTNYDSSDAETTESEEKVDDSDWPAMPPPINEPLTRCQIEQEANEHILSSLVHNQLPDLACDTLLELLFLCVILAMSWIFIMIVHMHCQQLSSIGGNKNAGHTSASDFYCDNAQQVHSIVFCNGNNGYNKHAVANVY